MGARTDNSFDFVRFCAASAVLFSHHFDLTGRPEPQVPGLGQDFGELGVAVFFCLSGFLIHRSLETSTDWARFVAARVLRIYPNLAAVLIVTSAATLAWYANAAEWRAHVAYVVENLAMFVGGVRETIPGVFGEAVRPAVNEPLWSLPYELWLYAVLYALVALGGRHRRAAVMVAALAFGLAWTAGGELDGFDFDIGPLESTDLARLGACFLSGSVLASVWGTIGRHAVAIGVAGLAATFAVHALAPVDGLLDALALAAAVVGLGSARPMAWFARGGDASYGMYVFAWPVQQATLMATSAFWPSMLLAFGISTAIGYGTWHLFERRAMTYSDRLAARLRGGGRPRAAADLP